MDQSAANQDKPTFRFLSFANDKEDAENEAKLKDAAARIEQALAREKALGELVECRVPQDEDLAIDPANDHRSLYERLQEQRNKKKSELEESQKLSNLITKLDEDDVSYLNEVAKSKREEELRKRLEIHDALEAKKLSNEQKMLEKERQLKELLKGCAPSVESKRLGTKSRISSMVKIKPKLKNLCDVRADSPRGEHTTEPQTYRDGEGSKTKRPCSPQPVTSNQSTKKQFIDESDRLAMESDQLPDKNIYLNNSAEKCTCSSAVSQVVGILPSLPIMSKMPCLDSDDTDYSDDEVNVRLVPRLGAHKR